MRNQRLTTKNGTVGVSCRSRSSTRSCSYRWLMFWLVAVLAACSPQEKKETTHQHDTTYTCPMHPQVVQESPGSCPVCGMDLVAVTQGGSDREIVLSERQVALANIRVAAAGYSHIGHNTFLTGKVVANRELTSTVSSRTPGRIEKLYIKASGLGVEKGAPLYEIYSEQLLTLQREYLLTLEQYHALGQREKRYAGFMESARKKLLLYGMSEAQVSRLSSSGSLSPYITFRAPASGIVREIMAAEGEYVAEGSPLYRLERLDRLWVEAELYPRETGLTSIGDKVQVLVHGYENRPAEGKVVFLSPEYRAGSQVITLRAEIANPEGRYIPGMQATVVLASESEEALALPADAVIQGEDGAHVWVKTGEGTFLPRIVKTGLQTFDKIEILEGLQQSDSIVVSGAYLLYSELVLKKGSGPGHAQMDMSTSRQPAAAPPDMASRQQAKAAHKTEDEFRRQLTEVFAQYFRLKDALVATDAKHAKAASARVVEAIKATDGHLLEGKAHRHWMEKSARLLEMLDKINSTEDIGAQRASFALLSKSLYEWAQFFGGVAMPVYYQYCPMAFNNTGAYWLSGKEEISNPYFGEKMLRCGAVKETIDI